MTPTVRQRQIGWAFALALTIVGSAVLGEDEPAPIEPLAPPAKVDPEITLAPAAASAPKPLIMLDKLNRTPPAIEGPDLFAAKSWIPPPPPPPPPVKAGPPPAPTAPQLPFGYVGQFEGKDGFMVYLARGNELLSVKPGEQIGTDYQVETVTAEKITLLYIPLGQRQTLATGGKK